MLQQQQLRFNSQEAERFLEALRKSPSQSWVQPYSKAVHIKPKAPFTYSTAEAERLASQYDLGVVINEGGRSLGDITACLALYVEWDNRTREWQLSAWRTIGLRPTFMVDTGGKSIHCYWVLDQAVAVETWKPLQDALCDALDGDTSLKSACLPMRLPGSLHHDAAGEIDGLCWIHEITGKRYGVDELRQALSAWIGTKKPADRKAAVRASAAESNFEKRTLQEIKALFSLVPPFVSSGKETESTGDRRVYRDLMQGLVAELENIGEVPSIAYDWVKERMPEWKGGRGVVDWAIKQADPALPGLFYSTLRELGVEVPAQRPIGVLPVDKVKPKGKSAFDSMQNTQFPLHRWLCEGFAKYGSARRRSAIRARANDSCHVLGYIRIRMERERKKFVEVVMVPGPKGPSNSIADMLGMDVDSKQARHATKRLLEEILDVLVQMDILAVDAEGRYGKGSATF